MDDGGGRHLKHLTRGKTFGFYTKRTKIALSISSCVIGRRSVMFETVDCHKRRRDYQELDNDAR